METPKRTRKSRPSSRRPARAGANSRPAEKMQANLKSSMPTFGRRELIFTGTALAVLLVILGIIFWFYKVYASPQNVFWGMVNNNLATPSITRQTSQSTCLPVNAQMTNVIQISFTPKLQVHCITTIENGSTKLTIESMGDVDGDYQHYLKIDRPGSPANANKYKPVYDLWLKNNGNPQAQPKLYSLVLNDPAIFGFLPPGNRQDVVSLLKQAYSPDFSTVIKRQEDGRTIYTYQVQLDFKKYAQAEKLFAETLNLPIAKQIDPNNYPPGSKVKLVFKVDSLNRQLVQAQVQSLNEKYSSYGVQNRAQIPTRISSNEQLQKAFQNLSR